MNASGQHVTAGASALAVTRSRLVSIVAGRPVVALLLLHAAQFAFLFHLVHTTTYCCDADYYVDLASRIFSDGLLYEDVYSGYRSYLVPLVLGVLRWPVHFFHGVDPTLGMRVMVCFAYSAVSFATTLRVVREAGWRDAATVSLPIFFNPLVLHLVPLPLQEAVIALLVLPMLVLLLTARTTLARRAALAILCGTVAFLIRLPMAWMIGACLLYLFACYRWDRASGERFAFAPLALACVVSLLLLLPQLLISHARFHSWTPYPSTLTYRAQVAFGIDDYRYDTVISPDHPPQGLAVATPYKALPGERKTLAFYVEALPDGPLLALAHVWIALHPWSFRMYPSADETGPSLTILASSAALMSLALIYLDEFRTRRDERKTMALLVALVALSSASIAFAAVETRFGIISYSATSVAAMRLLADREGRRRAMRNLPLVIGYVSACVLLGELLWATR